MTTRKEAKQMAYAVVAQMHNSLIASDLAHEIAMAHNEDDHAVDQAAAWIEKDVTEIIERLRKNAGEFAAYF